MITGFDNANVIDNLCRDRVGGDTAAKEEDEDQRRCEEVEAENVGNC